MVRGGVAVSRQDGCVEGFVRMTMLAGCTRRVSRGACQKGVLRSARACACCSASSVGMCLEKRAFYRLVSGMHASINTHLSAIYLKCGGCGGNKSGEARQ